MTNRRRVYWHGVFPDFNRKGTVVAKYETLGTVNLGVLWDGDERVHIVPARFTKPTKEHAKCDCGRCGAAPGP